MRVWGLLPLVLLLAAAPAPRGAAAFNDPARLVALAKEMEARGQGEQAMGLYGQALSIDPANVAALAGAGQNALVRGDGAMAVNFFTALTKIQPSNAEAFLSLGAARVIQLQPQEALTALAQAEKLGASAARVGSQRGLAYDLLGDYRSAQVAYAGTLAAQPDNVEAARRLALSLAVSGSRPAALQVMRRFETDTQSAVPLRQTLAMIYALTGDPETADEIARSILPADAARQMSGFFAALPALSPHDKTMAALFGRLPDGAARPAGARPVVEAPPAPVAEPKHVAVPQQAAAPAAADRIWLQLANVVDPSRLAEAWKGIVKAGGPDLESPKTAPAGNGGYRLLIGPYANRESMNDAVVRLKARGVTAFPVTTPKSTQVTDLPGATR